MTVQPWEEAMKQIGTAAVAVIALVTATAASTPTVAHAGPHRSESRQGPHYRLIDLGTFGGPNSAETQEFPYISNRGTVVGYADTTTPDNTDEGFAFHAFRWRKGVMTDLGTLPGGVNSVANVVNNEDVAVGFSEDAARAGVAVKWTRSGRIVRLGTLGGTFGFAADINDHGQIIGPAANTVPDPYSIFGWPTQTRAFLWEKGVMRDLGTLGGPDAAAFFINKRGQVAGESFTDSTPNASTGNLTRDPFLWQHGKMIDLGTLGGTNGFALDLNNWGQVVGASNLAGDVDSHPFLWDRGKLIDLGTFGGTFGAANAVNDAGEVAGVAGNTGDTTVHAFFWKNGVKTDLGTIDGDTCSTAHFMNAKGQVVGTSGDCQGRFEKHGFLWQRGGSMIDLNAFVPPGSNLTVTDGETINDRGEIAGSGQLPNGDFHAVVLIPCNGQQAENGCQGAALTKPAIWSAQPQPATSATLSPADLRIKLADEKRTSFGAALSH
jgi:probable HAF family extracellular repeat protein